MRAISLRRNRPSLGWGVLGVVLSVALAGCGSTQDLEVQQAAEDFTSAVRDGDARAACDLLAPATRAELEQETQSPCAQGLLREVPPLGPAVGDVEVFGTAGRVRSGSDVVFLARFRGGWKVSAVGCTATRGALYDCRVKGS